MAKIEMVVALHGAIISPLLSIKHFLTVRLPQCLSVDVVAVLVSAFLSFALSLALSFPPTVLQPFRDEKLFVLLDILGFETFGMVRSAVSFSSTVAFRVLRCLVIVPLKMTP